ncbi:conserved hypothetical protein [Streptomyces clavuligerus]|nr:conserved hypothetical protein [Streptomyces clavuligerus]
MRWASSLSGTGGHRGGSGPGGLLRSAAVSEALPEFPYHPDPVATGVVVPSPAVCVCCGRARGHLYTGPVHAEADLGRGLCPWCIADGSAAGRFDASFTDGSILGEDVPLDVFSAVDRRTPGFRAWQAVQWFFHCGDGTAFLGEAGPDELAAHPDALGQLRRKASGWGWPPGQIEHHLNTLGTGSSASAYLFRCRHCGIHLAYSDFA